MPAKNNQLIINTVLKYFPDTQAIYLFGSYDTVFERKDSDVDIALLLPALLAKKMNALSFSDLVFDLEKALKKRVDIINLRRVSTVFQKEIIASERRIFCADEYGADEFEMLTLSFYQKLNEERKEILEEFFKSKRAYAI